MKFLGWASANGLTVNNSKCNFISLAKGSLNLQTAYTIGNVSLERVDSIRDLGVMIDSTMTFDVQIFTVVKKSLKILGFIKNISSDYIDHRRSLVQIAVVTDFNLLLINLVALY